MTDVRQTSGDAISPSIVEALRDTAILIALAVGVFVIYAPVANYEFLNYDDPGYIFDNMHVTNGLTWDNIKWAFQSTEMSNWQPLVWLSYMTDVTLFGANRPGSHHLMNVAMHLASSILLYLILKRMTRRVWPSAFVAALFAVHPLHVESVAWIAERKDVLSVLFWMLTMGAYVAHAERPSFGRYILVFIFLALGLMTKPMLVTLPFVLLLLDVWPLGRFGWLRRHTDTLDSDTIEFDDQPPPSPVWLIFVEKIPLLGLVAISSYITFSCQSECGAMDFGMSLSFGQHLSTAIMAYAGYLFKTVWPTHMAAIYPYILDWPFQQVVVAATGMGLATVAAVLLVRRMPYLGVGWLWFLGTLVPVIGIVQVGLQSMADRYTYIPLTGLFIAVAFLASDLGKRREWVKIVSGVLGAAVVIALTVISTGQIKHWSNSEALFRQASTIDGNYVAHNNLSAALLVKPMTEEIAVEALDHARKAVALKADYADAHCNIGLALSHLSHYAENDEERLKLVNESIASYRDAIRFRSNHSIARANLAAILINERRFQEACDECAEALRWDPNMQGAQENWAIALQGLGKPDEAVRHYMAAIAINPATVGTRINCALCWSVLGYSRNAAEQFRAAASLQPNNPQALNGLAWILATDQDASLRNGDEAVLFAERAVNVTEGNDASTLDTLAAAYAAAGRIVEAVATAERAEKVAIAANRLEVLQGIRQRLALYRAGKPYISGT
jgi:protein O-mannosyl-transferase